MTTTLPKASVNGRPGSTGRGGGPLPVRQKRPGYAVIAIVLIVGLGALGAYFYTKAGQKTPVVVVTKDVAPGTTVVGVPARPVGARRQRRTGETGA